jgi:hypothetical protein
MPSDPRNWSNEIMGILDLEPKTPLVITKLVDVPNVAVGTPIHEFGSKQKRPPTRYGEWIFLVDQNNYACATIFVSIPNEPKSFEEVMVSLKKEHWIQAV